MSEAWLTRVLASPEPTEVMERLAARMTACAPREVVVLIDRLEAAGLVQVERGEPVVFAGEVGR